MLSDGVLDLFVNDVITNKYKTIHPNKIVYWGLLGSHKLYEYIDDNPAFAFLRY